MTTHNTFSNSFIQHIDKFKKESIEYENSQTFESRFNKFKTHFEASWKINLKELDNSGAYEMFIDMPLHQDVKDEMVKILATYGFREVESGKMEKNYDYYSENNKDNTYFCVIKNLKQCHKLAK